MLRIFILSFLSLLFAQALRAQTTSLDLSAFTKDTTGLSQHLKRKITALRQVSGQDLSAATSRMEQEILSLSNKKARLFSFSTIGRYLYDRNLYKPAIRFFENALILSHEIPNSGELDLTDILIDSYAKVGEPGKSLDILTSQLARFEASHDLSAQVFTHSMLLGLYYRNEESTKCLDECRKVDSLSRLVPGGPKGYLWSVWVNSWNTGGLLLLRMKSYKKGLVYFDSTKKIALRHGDQTMFGLATGNSAAIYFELNDFPKALEAAQIDMKLSRKAHEFESAASTANFIAKLYLKTKQFELCKKYLDSSALLRKPGYNLSSFNYYSERSALAAAYRNFEEAYRYQLKAKEVRDSIDKLIKPITLNKAIIKASMAEREKHIELLKNKSLLQEQQLKLRNLFIGSVLLIVGLLLFSSVVYYRRYHDKKRDGLILKEKNDEIVSILEEIQSQHEIMMQQKLEIERMNLSLESKVHERTLELEIKNRELDTFIYRASHDIRRPITTILGLNNVFKLLVKDSAAQEIFALVSATATSMDNMLYKMRMIYELNQVENLKSKIGVEQFIEKSIIPFEQSIRDNDIDVKIEGHALTVFVNEELFAIVLKNLIENAIQFSRPVPQGRKFILISYRPQRNHIVLQIEDNGIGIEEEYLPKIFDLYFRGSARSTGNGLGLFLVKKAIEKMEGTVAVQSKFGVGTTFTVSLPIA